MIKVKDRKLLLLPGDGIGPEVVREVRKIIEWFNKNKSLDFKIEEDLVAELHTINIKIRLRMRFFTKHWRVRQ